MMVWCYGQSVLNFRFCSLFLIRFMFRCWVMGVQIFSVLWVMWLCVLWFCVFSVCMLCRWLVSLIMIMCRLCDIVSSILWKFLVVVFWWLWNFSLFSLVMLLISLVMVLLNLVVSVLWVSGVFLMVLCRIVVISVFMFRLSLVSIWVMVIGWVMQGLFDLCVCLVCVEVLIFQVWCNSGSCFGGRQWVVCLSWRMQLGMVVVGVVVILVVGFGFMFEVYFSVMFMVNFECEIVCMGWVVW